MPKVSELRVSQNKRKLSKSFLLSESRYNSIDYESPNGVGAIAQWISLHLPSTCNLRFEHLPTLFQLIFES